MQQGSLRRTCAWIAVASATIFAVGPVFADKPDWAGGGKGEKHEKDKHGHEGRDERRDDGRGRDDRRGGGRDEWRGDGDGRERRGDDRAGYHGSDRGGVTVHFGDRQRTVIREYYTREVRVGHCPPGLAKKGNGCMPPGQAKKWAVGRPLPREVVYYDLPPSVVVELGMPPPNHRFVRVAGDILMIAIGTGLVVDAIEDLGGM
jgi:Ni/Co efflux regulator RcnB